MTPSKPIINFLAVALFAAFALSLIVLFAKFFPKGTAIAVVMLLAYTGVRNFIDSWRRVKWISRRKWGNYRRAMRKSLAAPPLALALYAGCLTLGALVTCLVIYIGVPTWPVQILMFLFGALLCVATIIDWSVRINYLSRSNVFRTLIKWGLGFLATTTVFFSTVLAKQFTHMIALADPSSMPEFVRILTALLFPFALGGVISISLTIVMSIQSGIFFVVAIISAIQRNLTMSFGGITLVKKSHFLYRLIKGRHPPISRPQWQMLGDGLEHLLRPFGTGSIALVVILLIWTLEPLAKQIPISYLQRVLVSTEYRNPHLCENVDREYSVAYLEDGFVSIAKPDGDGYKFSVSKCHKDA